jgi:hypothetical protein
MIRRSLAISLVLSLANLAAGQSAPSAEVQAAILSARAELRGQILAASIVPGMSVKSVTDRDPAFSIDDIVDTAEQVGQPRWVEDRIVQVRLQVPASKIVDRLGTGPADRRDPRLTPAQLDRLGKDWRNRSFQATGQAIPVSRIESLVAQAQPAAWVGVPQAERANAASRAHASAAGTVVSAASNIRVGPSETIDQSFKTDARDKLSIWAMALPATRVVLRDDRQVEVALYVDRDGLEQQLMAVVNDGTLSSSEKVESLKAGIAQVPSIIVGRAAVQVPQNIAASAPFVLKGVPDWASDPLVAEGASARTTSRLQTARQAERNAQAALRESIIKLKLNDDLTVGQAASSDPRVTAAVDRVVDRARVYQVDYHADGSATVRVSVDANDLLDELTSP